MRLIIFLNSTAAKVKLMHSAIGTADQTAPRFLVSAERIKAIGTIKKIWRQRLIISVYLSDAEMKAGR